MAIGRDRVGSGVTVRLVAAISTIALAASLASPSWAQDAPAQEPPQDSQVPASADATPTPESSNTAREEGGEIVVTGIRAGVRNSISLKRNEQSIVEAVSAEEIGKLPDISIAESIARLPGLAAQRVNGRAQSISIRGLAPDFSTTLLNGRQQASSGDNRAVEFDQYPSELLNSVVIYKTPDANVAGMGLAGTADLRTVRPLSYGKRAIALNLRGELNGVEQQNADVKRWGWRGSASYIDQLTPELGIALGLAYIDSPSTNQHFKGYNFEKFCPGGESWCTFLHDRISPDSADGNVFMTGQELFAYSRNNKRLASIGIVEWEPSDRVHSILDLYYSRFKQRETMRGAQWFSNLWADDQTFTDVGTEQRGDLGFAVSGAAHNVAPIIRNDYNTRDDWLFSAGLNNEIKITDELTLLTDLSYSRNKRTESVTETYAGFGCCVTAANQNANRVFDTISWDLTGNGFPSYQEGLNYGDANQVSLGDRAPWGGWGHDGTTRQPHVKEQVYAFDGGLRYEPAGGAVEAVDIGVNFTRRDKRKRVDEWNLNLKNDRLQVLVENDLLVDPTSLGFAGFGNVLSYDVQGAVDRYYDVAEIEDAAHFDKAWLVKEDVLTLKARTQFAFGDFHGNIGLQAVHQKQRSEGQRISPGSPVTIALTEQSSSYWDILPSLNTFYDFGGGHRLRFAAAKVLARPRMDELRANLTPSFSNPCGGSPPCVDGQEIHPWSASGGNPLLKPWRAKAVDLSYEWYIGPASYIAIAGFYKKLDSYIYNQLLPYDFSGLPLPSIADSIPPGVIISPLGTIRQPANGEGGNIRGFELSGALEFGRVTKFLDGFGVIGSLSKTKSNLKAKSNRDSAEDEPTRTVPGLSGTVYNVTGYYEKQGFQARISYRYRSSYRGEVVQLFANRGITEILADKQVDAQIGYTFPEGSRLENLGIQLQVYNLTNSPYRTRKSPDSDEFAIEGQTDATFIETYEKYGRQFLFGINYRF